MTDLSKTIAPKSDQLNADDLIAGPRTITITSVRGCEEADQPIAVHFEGDDRKPYKPCKSMRRVMVHVWGADGNAYPGKRMTLVCDPNVAFGGIKVGGIRISHMTGIDRDMTMALTVTRAQRKPYTVKPLSGEDDSRRPPPHEDGFPGDRGASGGQSSAPASDLTISQRCDQFDKRVKDATTTTKLKAVHAAAQRLREDADRADPERWAESQIAYDARYAAITETEARERADA